MADDLWRIHMSVRENPNANPTATQPGSTADNWLYRTLHGRFCGVKPIKRPGRSQKQATHSHQTRKLQAVCDDSIVGLRNSLLLQLGHESMRHSSGIFAFMLGCKITAENMPYSYENQKQISLVRVR